MVKEATSSLAMDTFSCSVRHGAFTIAVQLMKQGRATFWTQLTPFRPPVDDLSASGNAGEASADEFKQVSCRLRIILDAVDASTEDESMRIPQLTMSWDDVISRILMLIDFSRFLLPLLFSDHQKAAEDASRYSCDALVVLRISIPHRSCRLI